jgi:hypothetical protein
LLQQYVPAMNQNAPSQSSPDLEIALAESRNASPIPETPRKYRYLHFRPPER